MAGYLEQKLTFQQDIEPSYTPEGPLRVYHPEQPSFYFDAAPGCTFNSFGAGFFWASPRNEVPCVGFSYPQASVVLVYAHANHEDLWRSHRALDLLRTRLSAHVLAFEYPGYWPAPGDPSQASTTEALRRVLRYLTERCGFGLGQVVLVGRSIGTGITMQVAAELEGLGGVVLISPFTSIRGVVEHGWGNPLLGCLGSLVSTVMTTNFDSLSAVAALEAPLLLLHGEDDDLVPIEHSEELLYAASRSRQPLMVGLAGKGHNDIWDDPELLIRHIKSFVAKAVSLDAPARPLLPFEVTRWVNHPPGGLARLRPKILAMFSAIFMEKELSEPTAAMVLAQAKRVLALLRRMFTLFQSPRIGLDQIELISESVAEIAPAVLLLPEPESVLELYDLDSCGGMSWLEYIEACCSGVWIALSLHPEVPLQIRLTASRAAAERQEVEAILTMDLARVERDMVLNQTAARIKYDGNGRQRAQLHIPEACLREVVDWQLGPDQLQLALAELSDSQVLSLWAEFKRLAEQSGFCGFR